MWNLLPPSTSYYSQCGIPQVFIAFIYSFPIYSNSQRYSVWYDTFNYCCLRLPAYTLIPTNSRQQNSWFLEIFVSSVTFWISPICRYKTLYSLLTCDTHSRSSRDPDCLPRSTTPAYNAVPIPTSICERLASQEPSTWNTTANIFTSVIIRCKFIKSHFLAQLNYYSVNSDVQMILKFPAV